MLIPEWITPEQTPRFTSLKCQQITQTEYKVNDEMLHGFRCCDFAFL